MLFARKILFACTLALAALAQAGYGDDSPKSESSATKAQPWINAAMAAEPGTAPQNDDLLKGCTLNKETSNPAARKLMLLFCYDMETTGALTTKVSGSQSVLAASCAEWAKPTVKYGSSKANYSLDFLSGARTDPEYFQLAIDWPGYTGPQKIEGKAAFDSLRMHTYFAKRSATQSVEFTLYDTGGTGQAKDAETVLDVNPDGSGSFSSKGLNARTAGPSGALDKVQLIDVKATWRCFDREK